MAIKIENKEYLSYEEQVLKNKKDIEKLKEAEFDTVIQEIAQLKARDVQQDGRLDAFNVKVDALDLAVNTYSGIINTLSGQVSALDGQVQNISSNMSSLSNDLLSLQGTIFMLEGKFNTLDAQVGQLITDVANVVAEVDEIKDATFKNFSGIIQVSQQTKFSKMLGISYKTYKYRLEFGVVETDSYLIGDLDGDIEVTLVEGKRYILEYDNREYQNPPYSKIYEKVNGSIIAEGDIYSFMHTNMFYLLVFGVEFL